MPLLPVLGAIGGAVVQGIQNRQNFKRSMQMYNVQRQDALADWNMQNQYNSPEAQMRRLREAGLNPNLVYGNGADATSSSMPRQSNIAPAQVDLSQIGGAVNNYMNIAQAQQDMVFKNQQVDNLKEQNELLKVTKMLKQNQIITETAKALGINKSNILKDVEISYKNTDDYKHAMQVTPWAHVEKIENEIPLLKEKLNTAKTYNQYQSDILKGQLSVQKANVSNLNNQIENRDKMTNSQVSLNLATELLRKAETENVPYKRDLLKAQAQQLLKNIDWTDALNRAKIGTSIANSGSNIIKSFLGGKKSFIKQ